MHTHANLELMLDALHEYAAEPAARGSGELVVMAKAPPCDWSPYFPFNPLWNQWTNATVALRGKVKLVMEVDLGYEMLGQNALVAQVTFLCVALPVRIWFSCGLLVSLLAQLCSHALRRVMRKWPQLW